MSTEDVRKHIFEELERMRQGHKRGIIYCKTDKEQVAMSKYLAANQINYIADASKVN